jgi:hypothetical protein
MPGWILVLVHPHYHPNSDCRTVGRQILLLGIYLQKAGVRNGEFRQAGMVVSFCIAKYRFFGLWESYTV